MLKASEGCKVPSCRFELRRKCCGDSSELAGDPDPRTMSTVGVMLVIVLIEEHDVSNASQSLDFSSPRDL